MNTKKIDKVFLLETCMRQVLNKTMKNHEAAFQLDLSVRQISRIVARCKLIGLSKGIARQAGYKKKPTTGYSSAFRASVLELVNSLYGDYGATLATEKLREKHGTCLAPETLRQWRIQEGSWAPHKRKVAKVHPLRARRAQKGELIQMDGSLHDWFESGDNIHLLVAVDDATGEIMHLEIVGSESFENYAGFTQNYMLKHGKPSAFYTDRHSVFSVNSSSKECLNSSTAFHNSLSKLGIKLILARSPQAKGRVERMNKTLQDRLVKFFREHNIRSHTEAQPHLEAFIKDYNRKKAISAADPVDAHIPLSPAEMASLNFIFSRRESRVVSKENLFRLENQMYTVRCLNPTASLAGCKIFVVSLLDGRIVIENEGGEIIPCEIQNVDLKAPALAEGKELVQIYRKNRTKDSGVHRGSCDAFMHLSQRAKDSIHPSPQDLRAKMDTDSPHVPPQSPSYRTL